MANLIVQHVTKEYPTPTEPLRVLVDLDLELARGENVAIVGPSGSGKSTFLQILGTLDRPTSGSVRLDGRDPFELSEVDLAAFRNEQIGFVFQDHFLLPQLTAMENVLLPALARGAVKADACARAVELLERVGLARRHQHRPAELSGGERQRVAIARALIHDPTLVLADEPTGNLDRSAAESITSLLLELQQRLSPSPMLVVVTHSPALANRMQRCLELDAGRFRKGAAGPRD
jgi:lipoprotein-releasing system ATP-binding protein